MSAERRRRPWGVLTLDTPPLRGADARLAIVVGVLGAVFLLVPRGLGWVGDHLWAEDGAIFLAEQHSLGVSSWFVTYGGYLHLIPRALATAFAGAPLEVYPSVMLACTVVFRLIAYGYAARLFASYLGSARWGIAAAAVGVLFLPVGQWEVVGNITNLRWTLDVLVVVLLMSVFTRPAAALWAGLLLFGAATSDPLVIGMAPLVLLRLVDGRGWSRLPALAFTAGAIGQALLMKGTSRTIPEAENFLQHPGDLGIQLALRGPLSTQFGVTWASEQAIGDVRWLWAAVAGTVVILLASLGARRTGGVAPGARVAFLVVWAGAGLALFLATMAFVSMPAASADRWDLIATNVPRYTALLCFFLTPVLVAAWQALCSWRGVGRIARVVALASMVVLAAGMVRDFGGYPLQYDTESWRGQVAAARAQCDAGGGPARLTLSPHWWGQVERACDGTITTLRRDP